MSALSPVGLAVVFLLTIIGAGQVVRGSWAGRPVYRGRHRRDDGIAIFYAEHAAQAKPQFVTATDGTRDGPIVVARLHPDPLGLIEAPVYLDVFDQVIRWEESRVPVDLTRWLEQAGLGDVPVVRRPAGAVELYPGGAWWAPTP